MRRGGGSWPSISEHLLLAVHDTGGCLTNDLGYTT